MKKDYEAVIIEIKEVIKVLSEEQMQLKKDITNLKKEQKNLKEEIKISSIVLNGMSIGSEILN